MSRLTTLKPLLTISTEKLGGVKVEVPEVTQSEMGQKQKLREVLDMVNRLLNLTPAFIDQKWSVDSKFLHYEKLFSIHIEFVIKLS